MQRVRVGDRVTVPFVCGCGKCSLCCSGNAQVCEEQWQPGFHGQGCWAQFVRVPQVVVLVLVVVLLIVILFVVKIPIMLCWGILMLVMMEVALVTV